MVYYCTLKFESFLELDECIERAGKLYSVEFGMWSQGGRMLDWGSDKILFTTGNYSDLTVSQNLDSPFGKILEVNTKNGEYSVSLSHLISLATRKKSHGLLNARVSRR